MSDLSSSLPHDDDRYNEIKVLQIRSIRKKGHLKAIANVVVGPWIIHGFMILQKPDSNVWIEWPSIKSSDGYRKAVYPLDYELQERIEFEIMMAWACEIPTNARKEQAA